MVAQFYCDIADMPRISDQEMGCAMQQLSNQHANEFDTITALKELFIYVLKYREEVSAVALHINCIEIVITKIIPIA